MLFETVFICIFGRTKCRKNSFFVLFDSYVFSSFEFRSYIAKHDHSYNLSKHASSCLKLDYANVHIFPEYFQLKHTPIVYSKIKN